MLLSSVYYDDTFDVFDLHFPIIPCHSLPHCQAPAQPLALALPADAVNPSGYGHDGGSTLVTYNVYLIIESVIKYK